MRTWSRVSSLTVLGAAAALAVACSGGSGSSGASSSAAPKTTAAPTVNVELKEFTVQPDKKSIAAGSITFNAQNKGGTPHELRIIKSDLAPDKLPVKDGKVDESAVQIVGKTAEIAAGKTEAQTTALTAGKYLLICNVPAHYTAGMTTAFTVE